MVVARKRKRCGCCRSVVVVESFGSDMFVVAFAVCFWCSRETEGWKDGMATIRNCIGSIKILIHIIHITRLAFSKYMALNTL